MPRLALRALLVLIMPVTSYADAPPPYDELTEFSANAWGADAQSASADVYDDSSHKVVGGASIRFETDGGLDTWLWAPESEDANWDLIAAGSGGLRFWVYADNPNLGFQGNHPQVYLYTSPADYFKFTPDRCYLNDARGQWVELTVPFNGNEQWTRSEVGSPDLAEINYVEFHGDTWDYGFTLWFDGVTFDVGFAPPEGLLVVAGNEKMSLEWKPFNDAVGTFDHYAVYRDTVPFEDTNGMTPIATLAELNDTTYVDQPVSNGVEYHYAVTAVFTNGGETWDVESVGPRVARDETDLQITSMSRLPRYPRYAPIYTYYEVTEPSGFGPYIFSAATGLGQGQSGSTQRWPAVGDPVTYEAQLRNRGTNTVEQMVSGGWYVDGEAADAVSEFVSLSPGDTVTLDFVMNWDGAHHEVALVLDVNDDRPENNARRLFTKSAPFLTYVDIGAIEDFRDRTSPQYPLAQTDDLMDWLWRHAEEMNAMFAEAGSIKRVHYDVLEAIHDYEPDPGSPARINFGIFPFRYYGASIGDPRAPGYYREAPDIDYGLCHEMSHQLGLIDIYQLNVSSGQNQVSNIAYSAPAGQMNGVSDFYNAHSAGGMNAWADIVHGYYGQYMYDMPEHVRLRLLDYNGDPLVGATVTVYQKCERPGMGQVITDQVKAQGVTDENGEWTLPNVAIDPDMVPTTYAGDTLNDNPFGYLAVVGTNGVLHFKIEYLDFVDYEWLDVTEVNVAYWEGQTDVATIERQLSIGGGVQEYPPADMAELNVENWDGWAQDGTITLADDTDRVQAGDGSIKAVATGGFDNYVRYPYGLLAQWDLSEIETIHFWAFAENQNGFQSASPWVRLGNFQDGYFEWRPNWDVLNLARDQWYEFSIPVDGNGTWTRTQHGSPTLSHVNYLQIHADTWGAGFTLWLDDVRFDPHPVPPYPVGDLDCDGFVTFDDIAPFVKALAGQEEYEAAYPDCIWMNADCNEDGAVTFDDIAPFIGLLDG